MKWKTWYKRLNLLKILDYYYKESLKQLKMKQKNKKGGYLNMLLGTLGLSLLGNILAGKGIIRAEYGS